MGQQIGLGSLVGLVVAVLSWRGNQTAQSVSTFPDVLTLGALAFLLTAAVRFVLRRDGVHGRPVSWHAGMTVAMATGVVFGLGVAGLGFLRFSHPTPLFLAFGFLTAFGSALLCGMVATLSCLRSPREPAA